jgi:signal transduction histidine kinase
LTEEKNFQGNSYIRTREEQLYHILLERAMEPFARYQVICTGEEGCDVKFLDVNPSYEHVMGVKRQDVIGKRFREIWPEAEDCWMDIIIKTIKTGRSVRNEAWSRDTGKYLEAVAFPTLPDEVAVLFLDRTRWKKSDEQLRKNEKTLLEYRQELRELAAKLSLSEAETRRKISRQIHDRIGYALVDILNRLRRMQDGPRDEIEEIASVVEKLIAESRELTFETASPLLYEVGLNAAIEDLAEKLLKTQGIGFSFQGNHVEYKADERVCILLYDMVRELLVNVIKHSGASFVNIRIYRSQKKIRVIVEDNGRGFPVDLQKKWGQMKGFGLFSIRERILPIGGKIQVLSEPGKGATVCLEAPLVEGRMSEWTKR